jgi:hypothetical protein
MVLACQLHDQLPALKQRCSAGFITSSAFVAFSTQLRAATERCIAAISDVADDAYEAELATDSGDESAAELACRSPAGVDGTPKDASGAAFWPIVADAMQTWLAGAESALMDWAAAVGSTGRFFTGVAGFQKLSAALSEVTAAA